MKEDKEIRFGWFVRAKMASQPIRLKEFSRKVGMSERRILQIQTRAKTIEDVPEYTGNAIAAALGMSFEQLAAESASTPVPRPRFKDTTPKKRANSRGPKFDAMAAGLRGEPLRGSSKKSRAAGRRKGPGRSRRRK